MLDWLINMATRENQLEKKEREKRKEKKSRKK
jgi:hypothetical protein